MVDQLRSAQHVELLTSLLESSKDLFWCTTADGRELLYLNGAAERIYGRPRSEFYRDPNLWLEVVHPDDRERVRTNLRHLRNTSEVRQEYRICCPDGTVRWLRDHVWLIFDAKGQVLRIGGIATDVSLQKQAEADLFESNKQLKQEVLERRQAQEALRESEALYHSLVANLPIYVTRTDLDGHITYVNDNYCRLIGLPASQILGKTNFDFHSRENAEKYRRDEQHVVETGEIFRDVEENRRGDDTRYFEVWKSPVRNEMGKVSQVQAVFWDVTERHEADVKRRQAEQALRAAKDAAEAANQAKSIFLANMSHEIRTPMNAIIGMTELMLDSRLQDGQRESLEIVRDSAESLLSIINDVLDFSKIEAQKFELSPAEFDLHESLGDAMRSLAFRAHRKNLELAYHINPDVPGVLVGDAGRLRQIILNLVGNAIKFTEEGEVILDLNSESMTNGDVILHFQVKDTGIGIPVDKISLVFDAFEQADNSLTRQYGGTGLGLAICRRLVELMDGTIWVDSEPGIGSTFHFTAKFTRASGDAPAKPRLPLEALRGVRVLIVDDNSTNRRILDELLRGQGVEPQQASGGEAALELMQRAQREARPFSLVITDINMPEMDGITFAERVREMPEVESTIIIALTSGDISEERLRAVRAGIAARLLKPVKRSELFRAILDALSPAPAVSQNSAASTTEQPAQLGPMRILLVEDSIANQKLAVGLLSKRNHTVTVANNGREAVAAFERQPFDIVLMDVQMPEMDGIEATSIIRELESSGKATHQLRGRTPIIAMTAHALKGDRERCLEAGMDGYVSKPIRIQELLESMQQSLAAEWDI